MRVLPYSCGVRNRLGNPPGAVRAAKGTMMGIFDDAKDKAQDFMGSDKGDEALDKAGDFADEKTGGKYSDQIDEGKEKVGDYFGGDSGDGGDDNNDNNNNG